ncbi:hypothetical protein niasHT_030058 [Heterodera trifolii]|uniref:Protein kinase domain-containing protein n=1 Tax=Heterodera trifolii TaxID=157864 RepID=A0ABD2JQK1_9BILA
MKLRYNSHNRSSPLEIWISSEDDFPGPLGMTSIGFFVDNDALVKCAAVNFFKGYEGRRIMAKTRNIMEQIQARLPRSQRQHIIELYDTGNALRFNEEILIMELSIETFHDRLYKRIDSYKNDQEMQNIIQQLTLPIMELHQVAIHMKITPSNYMYVSVNDEQILKIKNFESAKIIDSGDKNESYLFEIDAVDSFTSFNSEYMGPENYAEKKEISTKFDIWSLGMIIIEIHIDQLRFAEGKNSLNEATRRVYLREIGYLYQGFERNPTLDSIGLNKNEEIFNNSAWIKQYHKAISIVLQLWRNFPKTAHLVTNLLHNLRELRLTARGILDYLDGLCYPEEIKQTKNAKELRIFKTMDIGEFKRQLTKKMRANRLNLWRTENREMMSKYSQMRSTLKEIIKSQQQTINWTDKQSAGICEKQ